MTSKMADMAEVTINQAIQIALQHHRAGQLDQAQAIYRQILATHADLARKRYRGPLDGALQHGKRIGAERCQSGSSPVSMRIARASESRI